MKQKIALLLLFLSVSLFGESKESYYDKARKEMVNVIERDVESTRGYLGRNTMTALQNLKQTATTFLTSPISFRVRKPFLKTGRSTTVTISLT